jgi:hypothetical protein
VRGAAQRLRNGRWNGGGPKHGHHIDDIHGGNVGHGSCVRHDIDFDAHDDFNTRDHYDLNTCDDYDFDTQLHHELNTHLHHDNRLEHDVDAGKNFDVDDINVIHVIDDIFCAARERRIARPCRRAGECGGECG